MVGSLRGMCLVVVGALLMMRGSLYRLLLWAALREGRSFRALCARGEQNPINEAVADISAYCFFFFFFLGIFFHPFLPRPASEGCTESTIITGCFLKSAHRGWIGLLNRGVVRRSSTRLEGAMGIRGWGRGGGPV